MATAALLAGCAATPIPPWPSKPPITAPRPATVPSAAATLPATAPSQVTPISASVLEALPYSSEVMQRFPEPSSLYQTPGLAEGRRSFTTNEELSAQLQELAAKTFGQSARLGLLTVGTTQQGRPIHAVVATSAAAINPDALDETRRPTIMVVAGQRGTDAAPTEAALVMLKELAPSGLLQSLLQKVNVIVVPRANPDGFENATAVTADGTPLTHDHLLLNTPEARALSKLARDYRPTVVVDTEEFAAIQPTLAQFDALRANDAALQYGLSANVHEFVAKAEREWLHRATTSSLTRAGQSVDWSFSASPADKLLRMDTVQPISLHNMAALKNTPSLMVQSRGADLGRTHIQRRVHTQITALTAVLNDTVTRAAELSQVQAFVARDIASQACKGQLAVASEGSKTERNVVMLDPRSGAEKTVHTPWLSAVDQHTTQQRARPCGYWLSASSGSAVERLRLLGVNVQRVAEQAPVLSDGYTATAGKISLVRSAIDAVPGSYYISMNQPYANVAAAALEPDTPYSYVAKGVVAQLSDVARVMAPTSLVFEED